jgi:hypothetical protein
LHGGRGIRTEHRLPLLPLRQRSRKDAQAEGRATTAGNVEYAAERNGLGHRSGSLGNS